MKRNHINYVILAAILVIILLAAYISNDNIKLKGQDISSLNDGWTVEYNNSSQADSTLPLVLNLNADEIYSISQRLPADFPENMSIRIRSSMQYIKVYIDGYLVMESIQPDKTGPIYEPEVSAWYIIELPANTAGSELKLEISTPVTMMSGRINEIYYGFTSDLQTGLIRDNIVGVGVSIFILGTGILTGLTAFIVNNNGDRRIFYLSIFSITISIWLFSEIDLMQFLTGNRFIVGGISYVMLPISTATFILFLKEVALKKYEKWLKILAGSVLASLFVIVFLQIFMKVYLVNSFLVFNPTVLFISVGLLSLLGYDAFKNNNHDARKYFMIISFFVITIVLDVLAFISENFMQVSIFSRLGLGIFFTLLVIEIIKYVNDILRKEGETIYLEEVAYKDALTGGLNRSAFERDMDIKLVSDNQQPFRLAILDLNNLKEINDTYGHYEGDLTIITFQNSLETIFGEQGKCYRFGGDEFAVITNILEDYWFDNKMIKLTDLLKSKTKNKEYNIEAAYGSGIYNFSGRFGDFKHMVDMKMYTKKRSMKT